jgi:hypothetical protein
MRNLRRQSSEIPWMTIEIAQTKFLRRPKAPRLLRPNLFEGQRHPDCPDQISSPAKGTQIAQTKFLRRPKAPRLLRPGVFEGQRHRDCAGRIFLRAKGPTPYQPGAQPQVHRTPEQRAAGPIYSSLYSKHNTRVHGIFHLQFLRAYRHNCKITGAGTPRIARWDQTSGPRSRLLNNCVYPSPKDPGTLDH